MTVPVDDQNKGDDDPAKSDMDQAIRLDPKLVGLLVEPR
jgi:hypothetical protein